MNSFKNLVKNYSERLPNTIILKAKYSHECKSYEEMVLMSKIDKHLKNNNARSIALLLSMWLKENIGKLPIRAKKIAQSLKLKTNGKNVGYPHKGTYHWF